MLRRMAMLKLLALKEFHWRKLLNKILQTKKRLKIFQPLFLFKSEVNYLNNNF